MRGTESDPHWGWSGPPCDTTVGRHHREPKYSERKEDIMATQFVSCIACHRLRTSKTVMLKQTNRLGGSNKARFIFHTRLQPADGHGKRGCSFETVKPLLTNMSQQRNIKRVRNNRSKHTCTAYVTCTAQGHVWYP